MAFDGSGTYSLTYSFSTEAGAPPIEISKLDEEFTGIATALSGCILRNGTGLPVADIPWNGQKITGLGTASAGSHAMSRDASDARYAQLAAVSVAFVLTSFRVDAANLLLAPDAGIVTVIGTENNQTTNLAGFALGQSDADINGKLGFVDGTSSLRVQNDISGAAVIVQTAGGGLFTWNGNTVLTASTGLTSASSLNASNLGSGTVPDARFPATLPAVSAANLTSIPAASITGTLPAISGANLTALNGSNVSSGTVAAARLPKPGALSGVTIQSDPGGTPSGSAGDIFYYY